MRSRKYSANDEAIICDGALQVKVFFMMFGLCSFAQEIPTAVEPNFLDKKGKIDYLHALLKDKFFKI